MLRRVKNSIERFRDFRIRCQAARLLLGEARKDLRDAVRLLRQPEWSLVGYQLDQTVCLTDEERAVGIRSWRPDGPDWGISEEARGDIVSDEVKRRRVREQANLEAAAIASLGDGWDSRGLQSRSWEG